MNLTASLCTLCSTAIQNCIDCTDNLTCTNCTSGYIWNGTNCKCDPNFFNLTDCSEC